MQLKSFLIYIGICGLIATQAFASEYHVSISGSDDYSGTMNHPFKTIGAANRAARAGDTITVHSGTYREWIDPMYGGTSHLNRIVYRAAEGEEVFIKGSEVIRGWEKAGQGVWKVTLDNAFFGDYNPYRELVSGDWFLNYGRNHHTGEVYLNGKSFYEIDSLEKVFKPEILKDAQDKEGSLFQWYSERFTPYHYPHSTKIAGIMTTMEGDDRYINNIFIKTTAPDYDIFEKANRPKRKEGTMGFGLAIYDEHPSHLSESNFQIYEMSKEKLPVVAKNNLYLNGAVPYTNGVNEFVFNGSGSDISLEKKEDGIYLKLTTNGKSGNVPAKLLNSHAFGEAMVPEVPFENPDGNMVWFDRDYFNAIREESNNSAGPFSNLKLLDEYVKIWPR
ncbi:DUF1565 domain-containing protein [Aquiflexum sp.]|uniref:DUF1565 domain-containing protein n=1 Tax=Aquiflexum sp. TaxID=1872584 RepID=UPI003593A0FA